MGSVAGKIGVSEAVGEGISGLDGLTSGIPLVGAALSLSSTM